MHLVYFEVPAYNLAENEQQGYHQENGRNAVQIPIQCIHKLVLIYHIVHGLATFKSRHNPVQAVAAVVLMLHCQFQRDGEGITPKKNAYDYVNDIVKKNTQYYAKKGYSVVDRKGILESLTTVIRDEALSYQYRYEMYLYAKSLGYIEA